MLAWTTLTFLAVAGLLVAEYAGSRPGIWVAKPLASSGFVAAAVSVHATGSTYGTIVLAALVLGWLGDVLLIPKSRGAFRAGILSFLLGHLAFACAFAARGLDPAWSVGALIVLAVPAALVLRWLGPHLPAEMKRAVSAYVVVIGLMVTAAAGTFGAAGGAAILAGAVGFSVSDLSVARDRFVAPGFVNRAWGLPLYYAAQIVLASTAGT